MGDVKKLGLLLPLISGQKSRILNREKKGNVVEMHKDHEYILL